MTIEAMSPGERDKKMNEMASKAAAAFCRPNATESWGLHCIWLGPEMRATPPTR